MWPSKCIASPSIFFVWLILWLVCIRPANLVALQGVVLSKIWTEKQLPWESCQIITGLCPQSWVFFIYMCPVTSTCWSFLWHTSLFAIFHEFVWVRTIIMHQETILWLNSCVLCIMHYLFQMIWIWSCRSGLVCVLLNLCSFSGKKTCRSGCQVQKVEQKIAKGRWEGEVSICANLTLFV
jgi:hypothetical protein